MSNAAVLLLLLLCPNGDQMARALLLVGFLCKVKGCLGFLILTQLSQKMMTWAPLFSMPCISHRKSFPCKARRIQSLKMRFSGTYESNKILRVYLILHQGEN
ncbi:unnamed protein product [Prunus armeniaca]|uniref:Secreted protein n=1 Tax=Prunus armeniaca TaxID=36596 RepID=A0A6J5VUM6_PRUAR|nr:unnamed protein product [Prunus armeniaca]